MCVDHHSSIYVKGIQLLTQALKAWQSCPLRTSVSCFREMSMAHMHMYKCVLCTFPYCAKTKVGQSHIFCWDTARRVHSASDAWICACCSDWAVWHSALGRNMTRLHGVPLLSQTRVLLPPDSPLRSHTHAASQTKSISMVQGDLCVFSQNLAEENTPRFLRAV